MTVVYFEKKRKIKFGDRKLRIFVNMWDRTIIAADVLLVAGCIMQFLLTLMVRKVIMKMLHFIAVQCIHTRHRNNENKLEIVINNIIYNSILF